jgi:choline dehydrogenase-like flavoprotein
VHTYLSQNASQYLPVTYTWQQVEGYKVQRRIRADAMSSDQAAVLEYPTPGFGSGILVLMKETSRGTVLLNATDIYADPILDYNTYINPVDVMMQVEAYRFARRYHNTTSMQTLTPVETSPGANVTSDEDLEHTVRSKTGASTAHISGTCAMMPRELAGVVAPDLRVYGVTGLSVADSSIMPLIPGAHTCSSVYAVAEKVCSCLCSISP